VFGKQNEMGFIADFTVIKKALREILAELDHRLILPSNNPDIEIEEAGDNVNLSILGKTYSLPAEDVIRIDTRSTTAEDLARYILDKIKPIIVSENVGAVEVGLDEGVGQGAWARWEA
jgi:6-pyruvoyltetrahydropterin/6-carboxytetrahydropterin synthase